MEKENYSSDNESGSTMQLVNKSRTLRWIVMSCIESCKCLPGEYNMYGYKNVLAFHVTARSFADGLLSVTEWFTG